MKKFLIAILVVVSGITGCQPYPNPTPKIIVASNTPAPTGTATPQPPTPLPTLVAASWETVSEHLGVDMGSPNDRGRDFVDVAKTLRRWETLDADTCAEEDTACRYAPLDENGWPTSDARTVFFDQRPYGAWWSTNQEQCPQCQDGDFVPDMSGTYTLIFSGQAKLQAVEGGLDARSQRFDQTTNTTTADIVVKPGQGLLFIQFVNTRRTPQSALNTGISDVRLIRPGYDPNDNKIFTAEILNAVKPFSTLRFMNWVGGNNINPPFEAEDNTLEWAERTHPKMTQTLGEGVAWEYVIELANHTGKNIWINIPIHASDDYIRGLASLLETQLHPDARIYIEYSNEVWNAGFDQQHYNRAAARAEVEGGSSTLNNDGTSSSVVWAQRRYARRLMEISNIFRDTFGDEAINAKVRVIYSWHITEPDAYREQLQWLNDTYGPPNRYLYAIAGAGYYDLTGTLKDDSVETLVDHLQNNSKAHVQERIALQQVADEFELANALYEAGPDTASPLQWERDTQLLDALITAHRDPRFKDVILYDIWNNWFAHPGLKPDMYIFFTLQSPYSRWGMWGLTEDVADLRTPKYEAIPDLVEITLSPPPAPALVTATLEKERVYLTWEPSFHATSYTVRRSISPDTTLVSLADNLTETRFIDENISAGNRYTYVVFAINEQGESLPSLSVEVAP